MRVTRFWGRVRVLREGLWGASALGLLGGLMLTALAIVSLTSGHIRHSQPVGLLPALSVALAVLPVAWRRRAPMGCAIAFGVGVGVSAAVTHSGVRCAAVYPAGLLIAYSAARHRDRPVAVEAVVVVLAGQLLESVTDTQVGLTVFPLIAILTLGIWGGGRMVRSRAGVADALVERTRALERQREETARLAVEVEQLRVAGDLDLVARERVAEIVQIAERGASAAGSDPGAAREAFAGIERAGRESLNQMRGLLGVLRSDDRGELAPQPTLAQIDILLSRARAGGYAVEFGIDGDPRPLSEEIEVSAYSILQQLLAASLAPGRAGPVLVRVRYSPDGLSLEVTGDASREGGEALAAARERTSVYGGIFSIESPVSGRRLLRARLPAAVAYA